MPTLTTPSDDSSPLIVYEPPGAWNQSSSNEAFQGGYTSTWTQYATATFDFVGTSVAVNGSSNASHGAYQVTLDGRNHTLNGSTSHSKSFLTEIFNSGPIESGHHTLTIMNLEWKTLDIDSITWSCDLGAQNASDASLQKTTVDDTDPAFTWFPQGSWNKDPPSLASFSGQTGHSTSHVNASVNYTFSGDAVSIYGTTGPKNSQYIVQRPDRPQQEYTATRDISSSKVLLYFGDGFGPGTNHTVTLVNQTPGLFQIDYAVVHTVNSPSPSSSSAPSQPTSGPPIIPEKTDVSSSTKLPAGAIVAIAIAALAFVFLIVALWLVLRRNKTLWMRLQRGYMVQSQFDASTPPNGITPLPYSSPRPARSKANLPANDDDSFQAPPLDRAVTMQSTASTLVADHGSLMTQVGGRGRLSLKPLRLASRWGPATPATTHTRFSRSPSVRYLLREESEYYDPEAAAAQGIEEIPEDRVDDVLRHPIRRNEPSTYHWQSGLP
ncbi:hypothetical protein FB451DRAFT_1233557 [Mycena latifolia]|nr:hypothetical protein FB451DRAFT_1233557 [Mycena latifolia]